MLLSSMSRNVQCCSHWCCAHRCCAPCNVTSTHVPLIGAAQHRCCESPSRERVSPNTLPQLGASLPTALALQSRATVVRASHNYSEKALPIELREALSLLLSRYTCESQLWEPLSQYPSHYNCSRATVVSASHTCSEKALPDEL